MPTRSPPEAPAPARCAAHPERLAQAACSRCGVPVCSTCALPVEPLVCRACEERRRSLELQPPSAGRTLQLAWSLYRAAFGRLLGISAVFAVAFAAADHFAASRGFGLLGGLQLSGLVQLLVGTVGTVAAARLFLQAGRRLPLDAGEALRTALRRWPAAVLATFVVNLVVGFGLLLFVVPGLIAALSFCLVTPLLAATRLDANQALRLSRSLVDGKRLGLLLPLGAALAVSSLPSLAITLGASRAGLMALGPAAGWWVAPAQLAAETAILLCDGFLVAAQVACYQQLVAGSGAFQGVTETTI